MSKRMDTWEVVHTIFASELDKEPDRVRNTPIVDHRGPVDDFDPHIRDHG